MGLADKVVEAMRPYAAEGHPFAESVLLRLATADDPNAEAWDILDEAEEVMAEAARVLGDLNRKLGG